MAHPVDIKPGTYLPGDYADRPSTAAIPDAARTMAEQYNLTIGEATARLIAQSKGFGLEEEVRGLLGDDFGGLRFNAPEHRYEVWVRSGEVRTARASRVLDALAGRGLPTTGAVKGGVSPADKVAEATESDVPTPPAACNLQYCDPPLLAGVHNSNPYAGCTTAFTANAAWGSYNLTAGHCLALPSGSGVPGATQSTCQPVGTVNGSTNCSAFGYDIAGYNDNGGGDGGVIQVTVGFWANYPAVHVIGWTYPSYGIAGSSNPVPGTYYCHTGWRTSATMCGYALATANGVCYNGNVGPYSGPPLLGSGILNHPCMTYYDGMCSRPGDSGGPIFDPATMVAVGTVIGGGPVGVSSYPAEAACWSLGPEHTVGEPVLAIVGRYGLTVSHL